MTSPAAVCVPILYNNLVSTGGLVVVSPPSDQSCEFESGRAPTDFSN